MPINHWSLTISRTSLPMTASRRKLNKSVVLAPCIRMDEKVTQRPTDAYALAKQESETQAERSVNFPRASRSSVSKYSRITSFVHWYKGMTIASCMCISSFLLFTPLIQACRFGFQCESTKSNLARQSRRSMQTFLKAESSSSGDGSAQKLRLVLVS